MSANEMYLERRKQIENEIEILKQKLESMDMGQAKDQKNYGYAGSCGHILNTIQEINYSFLKNN